MVCCQILMPGEDVVKPAPRRQPAAMPSRGRGRWRKAGSLFHLRLPWGLIVRAVGLRELVRLRWAYKHS